MKLLENLKWRYATKKFDTSKKVSEVDLGNIKEAVRLSASSYGLQAYKVLVIDDPEIRAKLRPVAWNQSQITDASHLFVFCSYKDVTPEHIDELVALKAEAYGKDEEELKPYGDFVKSKVGEKSKEEKRQWSSRQVYIALANLLTACAELKIDACPMEGFDPKEVGDVLGLPEKGLDAMVLATIGYRLEDDPTQQFPKVRKSMESIFELI